MNETLRQVLSETANRLRDIGETIENFGEQMDGDLSAKDERIVHALHELSKYGIGGKIADVERSLQGLEFITDAPAEYYEQGGGAAGWECPSCAAFNVVGSVMCTNGCNSRQCSTNLNEWRPILKEEFSKPYFAALEAFVKAERTKYKVYPPEGDVMNAFRLCQYSTLKVVIVGHEPYHGADQAHGLAFSVLSGRTKPGALDIIYRELGLNGAADGNLSHWSSHGVLLLNTILTVRDGEPLSHQNKGWETFTDAILRQLNERKTGLVFLFLGTAACNKSKLITRGRHKIIMTSHPSPVTCNRSVINGGHRVQAFSGSACFAAANNYLIASGREPICLWETVNTV